MTSTIGKIAAGFSAMALMSAYAQGTVGEVLDAGGAKLQKAQVVAYVSDSKATGLSASGQTEVNIDFKADGTFSGSVMSVARNVKSSTSGRWVVDENGKTCTEGRLFDWNMSTKECFYSYSIGTVIYRTAADSEDRNTKVIKGSTTLAKIN
ncbi:MAG: hypothetical protein V4614_02590 [Pseudomonadota bacterium]